MSLKQKAIKGIKWTAISSITIAIISIIQLSILTHYLSPKDYGLMAISMVIIGFSRIFSDIGISNAIIHKQNISHQQLSSLYWLNIISGITLFLIIALFSPFIATFYNQPQIKELLILVSFSFIILAFGNQFKIIFQKKLKFNIIAKIEVMATISAFIVAISLAMNNFGVYALVWATLISALVSSSLFIFNGLKYHKPSLYFNHKEIKSFISFGLFQIGENVLNYFSSQFDIILIGKLLGTEALGVYSVAKNLAMRPSQVTNPIITRVTFPIMSLAQDDIEQLKNIYLKTINYLASINFFIYIFMAILAEPIVSILFGDKWHGLAEIFQILCLYAMVRSIGNPIGSLQLAKGRADMGFYWDLGVFVFFPIAIYIGSFYGLIGISYGMLIVMVLQILLMWYFMVKPLCGAGFIEYFKQIILPLAIVFIVVFISSIVLLLHLKAMWTILLIGIIGVSLYIVLVKKYNADFFYTLKGFKR